MRWAWLAIVLIACDARELPPTEPTFDDVAPILERACASCHGGDAPAAGWRADRYLEVIACANGAGAPVEALSRALDRSDHAGLLEPREEALVRAWIEAGAPARRGEAHPGGFADPRSPDFHGRALRDARWAPLFDEDDPRFCARCHDDSTQRDAGVAPGATSCASCHDEEGAALACSTCHGDEGRAFPPRDPCFFPDDHGGAHRAHASSGIACAVCHGERDVEGLTSGEHGDGVVQVVLEGWSASSRSCAGTCHARGGSGTSEPAWDEPLELDCGSCHESPPADHYAGACSACHAEASADGTSLVVGALHLNGRVDLGDGSGGCGACHGSGDDPSPASGAHPAHHAPSIAQPFACAECHVVPSEPRSPGHFDRTEGAEVVFGALARARGAVPRYDGAGCESVACHGAGLSGGTTLSPSWAADTTAATCGACHGVPPPAPHRTSTDCGASICHGAEVAPGPAITDLGRALHVDGTVQP